MRRILFLVLVCTPIKSIAQSDSTNIYYQALKYYNRHLDEIKSAEKEIFVDKDPGFTEKLPKKIGNRKVTILTASNSRDHYKRNKNKIKYVKISLGEIIEDKIDIKFLPHYGEFKGQKKGFEILTSEYIFIHFQFDCQEKRFKYHSTSGKTLGQ
jgi:hypothetical protein